MSTETKVMSTQVGLLLSPQANLVSLFFTIILGASLIECNEILLPPKLTSLDFLALLVAYYGVGKTVYQS